MCFFLIQCSKQEQIDIKIEKQESKINSIYNGIPFSNINKIFVHENGDIFILDSQNHRIVKTDSSGKLQKIINLSKGEGSGEFVRPNWFDICEGFIYITDLVLNRITVIDTSGKLYKTFRTIGKPAHIVVLNQDKIFVEIFLIFKRNSEYIVDMYDSSGTKIGESCLKPRWEDFSTAEIAVASTGNSGRMGKRGERIVYSFFYPYLIKVFNNLGEEEYSFSRKVPSFKPPEMPKLENNAYKGGIPLSGTREVFFVDDNFICNAIFDESGEYLDFFDKNGFFIKTVNKPIGKIIGYDTQNCFYILNISQELPLIEKYKIEITSR